MDEKKEDLYDSDVPAKYEDGIEDEKGFDEFGDENYDPDIDEYGSEVASKNTAKILGILVIIIIGIFVLFKIFSGEKEKSKQEEDAKKVTVYENKNKEGASTEAISRDVPKNELTPIIEDVTPEENTIDDVIELTIPELPKLDDFPDEEEFGIEKIFSKNDKKETKKKEGANFEDDFSSLTIDNSPKVSAPKKNKSKNKSSKGAQVSSNMIVISGNGGGASQGEGAAAGVKLANSSAAITTATKIQFPSRTIAQGKLIEAVLETALNTEFNGVGSVRAIVSRDVFADFGKSILIPRGSRLIGQYSGSTGRGESRILINWNRLIRPDAVDIQINSPTTDQFGRYGVPGAVNNKYLEIFNNSILLSLLTIGSALAVEGATGSDGTETVTNNNGDTISTTSASDLAAEQVINSISSTGQTVLGNVLNANVAITVPHGTRIKVFTNQDLLFPQEYSTSSTGDDFVLIK